MDLYSITKNRKLALSIVFDFMGYVSYVFPPFDFIWAPSSAYLMTKMYKGRKGKIAAGISFVEEALPFIDFIPTFSLMWLYNYKFKRQPKEVVVKK